MGLGRLDVTAWLLGVLLLHVVLQCRLDDRLVSSSPQTLVLCSLWPAIQTLGVGPLSHARCAHADRHLVVLIAQKQKQHWPLTSAALRFPAPAVWDCRSQRFFVAASPSTAAAPGRGLNNLLLSWPQSFQGQLEDAPHSVSLPGPVFSLHPIFSSSAAEPPPNTEAADDAADAAEPGMSERVPEAAQPSPQEAKASGRREKALAQQAWVREWVEGASRAAATAAAEQPHEAEQASTSGRSAAAAGGADAGAGCPGVFVVHANGTVGLDTLYTRFGCCTIVSLYRCSFPPVYVHVAMNEVGCKHDTFSACCSTSNGHARVLGSGVGTAVAAASSGSLLAVVTQERKRKHFLSCFSMQARAQDAL